MKKIANFLLLFVLSIVVFNSCKKDENSNSNAQTFNVSQEKVLKLIEDFKTKMKNPLKTGEEVSLDSAVWLMEATVNETYARADNFRDIVYIDSTYISIPISASNTVSMIDMTAAYSRMVDSISQHYYEVTGEKGLIFVDLEVISIQNSQITIKVTDVVTSPNVSPTYQFGSTDYWFWGWAQGKCDGSGQSVGIDAADKLAQYANWSIPVLAQSFFTDVTETGWIYPSSIIATNGNPFGYGVLAP